MSTCTLPHPSHSLSPSGGQQARFELQVCLNSTSPKKSKLSHRQQYYSGKRGGILLMTGELTLQRPDLPRIKYPPKEQENILWVCSYCISFFWLLLGLVKEFMLLPLFPISFQGPQGGQDEGKTKNSIRGDERSIKDKSLKNRNFKDAVCTWGWGVYGSEHVHGIWN